LEADVNAKTVEPEQAPPDSASPNGMVEAVRKERSQRQRWREEGETSVMRFVGQIGVLGWIIDWLIHRTLARL